MVFVLSARITGNSPDDTGLSWDVDLSHTLEASLVAPDGVTFTSMGGLPTESASPTAVPEPTTLVLLGAGLLFITRRVRLRF